MRRTVLKKLRMNNVLKCWKGTRNNRLDFDGYLVTRILVIFSRFATKSYDTRNAYHTTLSQRAYMS